MTIKRLSRIAAIGSLLLFSLINSAVALKLSSGLSPLRMVELMELLETGRHEEAIRIAAEEVELVRTQYGRSHERTGAAMFLLSFAYQRADRQVEAIQPAIDAYDIISSLPGHQADAAEMAHTVGLVTRRAYDYVASERWLNLAIRQAEAFHGSTSTQLANYLEGLADTYQYQSKFGEAHPLYQKAFDIANAHSSKLALEIRERTGRKLKSLSPSHNPTEEEELKRLEDELVAAERQSSGETLDVANAVWELANAYEDRKRYADAITQFDRVIRIRSKILDRLHPALSSGWAGLGRSMIGDGKREAGLSMLHLALTNREKFFGLRHPQVAPMVGYVADAMRDQGDVDQAIVMRRRAFILTYLGYASPEPGRSHRPLEVARSAAQLATELLARSAAGDEDEALYYMAVSVRQFEQIRANVASMGEQHRALVMGRHNWAYEKLAQLLIRRGRIAEAERVLLLLKEANLREFLRSRGGITDSRGAEAGPSREDRLLLEALDKTGIEWAELEAAWYKAMTLRPGSAAGAATESLNLLNDRRIQLEGRTQAILREMTVADAGKALARLSPVDVVASAQTDLSQRLQAIHDAGGAKASSTVAAVFLPGPKGLIVVVTTRFGAIPLNIDIEQGDLGRLVIDFRTAIRSRGDYKAAGKRLHELLIDPVEKQLKRANVSVQQLAVLPYGELRDLPFSALVNHSGKHLIERYAIVGLGADGEGGLGALDAAPRSAWRVAGLGASKPDSAFNNVPLPGVTREICSVVVDAATQGSCSGTPRGLLPGQRFLDEAFTAAVLSRLMSPVVGRNSPSVLHIATHFDVDRSMLLLGDGDKISIGEISRWGPRLGKYDLVTLSACDTGRAAGNAESLGALFRKYGARAALVTLWPVADVGAEPFMSEFYRQRGAVRRESKAVALQRAQLALLSGPRRGSGDSPDLSHPYYWAGYLLIGNWQ